MKEEYHAFRDKMGVIMFVTGAALSLGLHNAQLRSQAHEAFSLTPPFMVGVQIFLCWMLYLYTALALRENVLKVCKRSLEACCKWSDFCRSPAVFCCSLQYYISFSVEFTLSCVAIVCNWSKLSGQVYNMRWELSLAAGHGVCIGCMCWNRMSSKS